MKKVHNPLAVICKQPLPIDTVDSRAIGAHRVIDIRREEKAKKIADCLFLVFKTGLTDFLKKTEPGYQDISEERQRQTKTFTPIELILLPDVRALERKNKPVEIY